MKILCQRDPKWSQIKLGKSNLTVGRYGCTTTCISMLSDFYKCFKEPEVYASRTENYTSDGLIVWQNFNYGLFRFVKRLYGFNQIEIDASLKNPKTSVILEVDNCHWVVALGKIPFTSTYVIADPWTGTRRLSSAYGKITGSAHFTS